MGSIPIFGFMKLTTRIIRGYGALLRGGGGYLAIALVVAVVTVVIVVPLWALAERYPQLYSGFAALCVALLLLVWIGARMRSSIRRVGMRRFLGKGVARIGVAALILVEGYGVVGQPILWVRIGCAVVLIGTLGLVFYATYHSTQ